MYSDKSYNKVSAVVDHFLIGNGLTEHFFQWALAMGLWHLRELKLDTWQDVKTALLEVTDRKTVVLPGDFVDWTKVGVKVGQYVITMGLNSELTPNQRTANDQTVAGLLSQHIPNGLDFGAYGGYYFNNFNGSAMCGWGGGFPAKGFFKCVNHGSCQELLLDYDFRASHVYVEYITDGFDPCGETVLHPYYADYFLKSMEAEWEKKKNPARTEASIRRLEMDLRDAERKVRARKNDLDPKTLINLSRAETRFTAKI